MNQIILIFLHMIEPNSKPARRLRTNTCPSMPNPQRCRQQSEDLLKLLPQNLMLMLYKYPSQLTCVDLLSLPQLPSPEAAHSLREELSRMQQATQWQQQSATQGMRAHEEQHARTMEAGRAEPMVKLMEESPPHEAKFQNELEYFINSHYDI